MIIERNDSRESERASGRRGKMIWRPVLALVAILVGAVMALTFLPSHAVTHAAPAAHIGAVSQIWYFAEGRVGAGYAENFTVSNPDATTSCAITVEYFYQPDGGLATTKSVPVTITAASRISESANTDLNILPNAASGASVAAVITVNTTITPNCSGVVAERAVYFNLSSNNSGDEVMGATHLGTSFFFADVTTNAGYSADIALFNPNSKTANVTINYYAGGQPVGNQTAVVNASTRSTLTTPTTLPAHAAIAITSDQPVLAERSEYFSAVKVGVAGTVSGGWSTIGTQSLSNDWLFAQGYTTGKFQEYLDIANLDPGNTVASVTITLTYATGTPQTFTTTVNPQSQLVWDVTLNNVGGVKKHVSAEVTSTGAKIVVECQMYFKYNHTVNKDDVVASGGSDVMGQQGPAPIEYNFADGTTSTGYDELLVLFNPTAGSEIMYISLVNGLGVVYNTNVRLYPHTNLSVNITQLVAKNMVKPGDGQSA